MNNQLNKLYFFCDTDARRSPIAQAYLTNKIFNSELRGSLIVDSFGVGEHFDTPLTTFRRSPTINKLLEERGLATQRNAKPTVSHTFGNNLDNLLFLTFNNRLKETGKIVLPKYSNRVFTIDEYLEEASVDPVNHLSFRDKRILETAKGYKSKKEEFYESNLIQPISSQMDLLYAQLQKAKRQSGGNNFL